MQKAEGGNAKLYWKKNPNNNVTPQNKTEVQEKLTSTTHCILSFSCSNCLVARFCVFFFLNSSLWIFSLGKISTKKIRKREKFPPWIFWQEIRQDRHNSEERMRVSSCLLETQQTGREGSAAVNSVQLWQRFPRKMLLSEEHPLGLGVRTLWRWEPKCARDRRYFPVFLQKEHGDTACLESHKTDLFPVIKNIDVH